MLFATMKIVLHITSTELLSVLVSRTLHCIEGSERLELGGKAK